MNCYLFFNILQTNIFFASLLFAPLFLHNLITEIVKFEIKYEKKYQTHIFNYISSH